MIRKSQKYQQPVNLLTAVIRAWLIMVLQSNTNEKLIAIPSSPGENSTRLQIFSEFSSSKSWLQLPPSWNICSLFKDMKSDCSRLLSSRLSEPGQIFPILHGWRYGSSCLGKRENHGMGSAGIESCGFLNSTEQPAGAWPLLPPLTKLGSFRDFYDISHHRLAFVLYTHTPLKQASGHSSSLPQNSPVTSNCLGPSVLSGSPNSSPLLPSQSLWTLEWEKGKYPKCPIPCNLLLILPTLLLTKIMNKKKGEGY